MAIADRLEASRRDLLDLSLRNQLLNHRPAKARGVTISDELPAAIYRLIWDEDATFSFLAGTEEAADGGDTAEPPSAAPAGEPQARHRDKKLQTPHIAERLQARLIATARDARFVEEEQGVNVLYLALGFLRWREPDAAADAPWRSAPLCLVPVRLARSRIDAQFSLSAADAEPLGNLTLAVKLKADAGITLPELPASDGLDLDSWFAQVTQAVSSKPGWQVESRLALDLFSFGRYLMWRDLDPAAWPAEAGPAQRPLVAKLFGGGFAAMQALTDLDATRPPERIGEVVEADGSQAEALAMVAAGADLVIQGPPGTGKSQTICNLISEAVAAGKSVLFVAEKMAALGVVQRRLESIGLGALCLELHSDKAAKRAVLGEIGRTLHADPLPPAPGTQLDQAYAATRAELNALAKALAAPVGASGLSPGAAIDLLAACPDGEALPGVGDADFPEQDATAIGTADTALADLQAALARTGPLPAHPWGVARISQLLPDAEACLMTQVGAVQAALGPARSAGTALATAIAADEPAGPVALERLIAAARHLAARPPGVADPESAAWTANPSELDKLFADGDAYAALRARHDATLIPEAWEQDLTQVRSDLAAYGEGMFRILSGAWRAANARLKGLCRGIYPKAHAEQVALADAVLAARRQAQAIRTRDGLGAAVFGNAWRGADSDWAALARARAWALGWAQGRRDGWPLCREPAGAASALAACEAAWQTWSAADGALRRTLAARGADDAGWDARADRHAAQAAHLSDLHDVCAVNRAAEPLAGTPAIVESARAWPASGTRLTAAVRTARLRALLARAAHQRPELARFDAAAHDRVRTRFADLDRQVLAANRARIAGAHRGRLPAASEGGPAALLRRESEKKTRHLPIRQLLREAGAAVQRVKPVFLMSPLSVAAYLEPGGLTFDLVVFDEASQVRPVDAVGALARARQAVVVGDSKQMPPTSFFDRLIGGGDEDASEETGYASDLESVLGLFLAAGCPSTMLRWHYRSRHPSLIAVSNRCFYEGRLRTFPSPAGAPKPDGDGLTLAHLPDAVYDRAKSRTNPREAAAVAEAVMTHARSTPELSLGVAAFSMAQMQAIASEVEKRRRADGSGEAFFAANPNEPFFVKNLENVQGDERDVILVSVGYGRDSSGAVALNFGPLNTDGGERRLNVLITRARRRMRVFTNLMPEDIDLGRTNARGLQSLREFLAYARDGRVAGERAATLTGAAARLAPAGAEAVCDGGIAWRSGTLAVRLDDETWCGAVTCRDRERLSDMVLTGLGWRIHHAWRLGWWRRPDEEQRRLAEALKPAT
jgi:hypothetical protein